MNMTNGKIQNQGRDSEDRRRAVEVTDRSFMVEASAGTGKTYTLIHRILHLVLEKGPTGPPLRLSEICAITFTEKAAGEMKVRLRQYFEQILLDPTTPPSHLNRAREALEDLETAAISIHLPFRF
jgi:ATP-dependent helicase/nuclease subunit A